MTSLCIVGLNICCMELAGNLVFVLDEYWGLLKTVSEKRGLKFLGFFAKSALMEKFWHSLPSVNFQSPF